MPFRVLPVGFATGACFECAEMVGHFGVESSLDKGLGQLLEKAFLADEVFRLLVIRQEGVDQVDWKWPPTGMVRSYCRFLGSSG